MKKEYIVIAILICWLAYLTFKQPKQNVIPEYYKKEFKAHQSVINSLKTESKANRQTIQLIKHEVFKKDSVILNADSNQLDSLFNEFFTATRHGKVFHGK